MDLPGADPSEGGHPLDRHAGTPLGEALAAAGRTESTARVSRWQLDGGDLQRVRWQDLAKVLRDAPLALRIVGPRTDLYVRGRTADDGAGGWASLVVHPDGRTEAGVPNEGELRTKVRLAKSASAYRARLLLVDHAPRWPE